MALFICFPAIPVQQPYENERSGVHAVAQTYGLVSRIVKVEFRNLHEKLAFRIPAGNLDRLSGRIANRVHLGVHGRGLHWHLFALLPVESSSLRAKVADWVKV
jgi:hypothetical protein